MLWKIIIKIILSTKLTNFVYNPLNIIVCDKYIEILLRIISILYEDGYILPVNKLKMYYIFNTH